MNDDIAISVQNLTKSYKLYDSAQDRLKESLHPLRRKYHKDFYALSGVSFEIRKGETVGIIGRNGSGKSTLLKLITGVLTPTSGNVTVNGKVSALLELGAGFNPDLTGLENVYFSGTLMGYTRQEMDEKMDDILAFADIGEFVRQPVKSYSSGMFVRLAFAVATKVEPEILIVDEALSVGDMAFQQKCLERFNQLCQAGVTIILVTHDIMMTRNYCSSVVYLVNGKVKTVSDPETTGEMYIKDMHLTPNPSPRLQATATESGKSRFRFGDDGGEIISVDLAVNGESMTFVAEGEHLEISVRTQIGKDVKHPTIFVQIRDYRGYILYGICTSPKDLWAGERKDDWREVGATLRVPMILIPGEYGVTVSLNNRPSDTISIVLDKQVAVATFTVTPVALRSAYHGAVNLAGVWLA